MPTPVAELNDRFRKTVPRASVLVPKDLEPLSPLLGMVDAILANIMNYEFPAQETGDHASGSIELAEGMVVRWEIVTPHKEGDTYRHTQGYHCVWSDTDLWGGRKKAGIPWNLEELEETYASHELVVYLPNIRIVEPV